MGGVISQIGLQRLDWFGFGVSSANRTGAFIACLIIAIWILFSFRLKWLSALAWIASIGLFYFLVQTASRGAIISLVCAGIFFLYFSGLKFEKKRYSLSCFGVFVRYFSSLKAGCPIEWEKCWLSKARLQIAEWIFIFRA